MVLSLSTLLQEETCTAAHTSYADFVPTAIELLDGTVAAGLDGKSLLPAFSGASQQHRDYIYGVSHNQGIQCRSYFAERSGRGGRVHKVRNFNTMEGIKRDRAAGREMNYFLKRGAKKHGKRDSSILTPLPHISDRF